MEIKHPYWVRAGAPSPTQYHRQPLHRVRLSGYVVADRSVPRQPVSQVLEGHWQLPQHAGHATDGGEGDRKHGENGLGALGISVVEGGSQGPALASANGSVLFCSASGSGRQWAR